MKKLEGIMPPVLVLADDGKNGDFGPPPSSLGDVGTRCGLRMRSFGAGKTRRAREAPTGSITRIITTIANGLRNRGCFQAYGASATTPSPPAMTWANNAH